MTGLRPDLFRDRDVVVIGGMSGIGGASAKVFADLGARVVVAGLGEASDALNTARIARVVRVDVGVDEQVDKLFASVDSLDVLVNCAGMIDRRNEYEVEAFMRVVDVNLTGTMRCCLAAHAMLRRTRGSIVNTASMLSNFGGPQVPAYTASKGGITQLTKALAVRWAQDGIRVNAVAPQGRFKIV